MIFSNIKHDLNLSKMISLFWEPVFKDAKPGETNQPAQFQKTFRGMKSVHHNSSFLIFDFKIFILSGVTQTCNPDLLSVT